MSRIVVIGGHGKVALLLTPILAELDAALDRETHGQTELLTGPEFAEGAAAMLGKRRPDFVSLR